MTDLERFVEVLHRLGFSGVSVTDNTMDMGKALSSRTYVMEKSRSGTDMLIGQTPRGGDDKSYMCWGFDHHGKLIEHGNWEF